MNEARSGDRLQKILSAAGIASRRAAEQMITAGRVSVNGAVAAELGTKADPDRDDIRVDGRRIRTGQRRRYILLNKPRGYMTTVDPFGGIFSDRIMVTASVTAVNPSENATGILYTSISSIFAPMNTSTTARP